MFSIVRCLLGGLVFCLSVSILLICFPKKKQTNCLVSIVIAVLCFVLLSFFPFEDLFGGFSSPEQAYRYYYTVPYPENIVVIEGESSDLVVGSARELTRPFIVSKKTGKWYVGTGRNTNASLLKHYDAIDIMTYQHRLTDEVFVEIISLSGNPLQIVLPQNKEAPILSSITIGSGVPSYFFFAGELSEEDFLIINGEVFSLS